MKMMRGAFGFVRDVLIKRQSDSMKHLLFLILIIVVVVLTQNLLTFLHKMKFGLRRIITECVLL